MKRNRHAKIVATLGPASSKHDVIKALFEAGADVFRLNFSHGSHDNHAATFEIIRRIERDSGRPIAILQDLQGPKIRIGAVPEGGLELKPGKPVRFRLADRGADTNEIPLPHAEVIEALSPGDTLMIDDGRLRLNVTDCTSDTVDARVVYGGVLTSNKGLNLPDTVLKVSPLTAKDKRDLDFGLELGVDWVALSFVQRPADILEARDIIADRAGIMAKIEKPTALERMDQIISLCDAIMVARGDLGVELPPEDVPGHQKELVRACRLAGKPVIVATHMLDSMMHSPQPTRAEASDVATAIYDGADAVMLSGESAAGDYPVEAVTFMDKVIVRTEAHKSYRSIIAALEPKVEPTIQHAVSAAAGDVAATIGASAILAYTSSGATSSRIARMRPQVPMVVVSPNLDVVRRMTLTWGAHPLQSHDISTFREMVERARRHVVAEGFARRRDRVVIVAGVPFGTAGSTNNLRVIEI